MSSNIRILLVIVFTLSLKEVNCDDWCSLIKPKGTYERLGLYSHFEPNGKELLFMYNKAGDEWNFETEFVDQFFTIKMVDNSIRKAKDMDFVQRYGFYISYRNRDMASTKVGRVDSAAFQCFLKTSDGDQTLINECIVDDNSQWVITDNETPLLKDYILLKWNSKTFQVEGGTKFYLFDPKNHKKNFLEYDPLQNKGKRFYNCSYQSCTSRTHFTNKMDSKLFGQIESTMYLGEGHQKVGHVFLFNIEGRPKYCFARQIDVLNNQYSIDDCKSSQDMPTLFEDCFEKEILPTEAKPIPEVKVRNKEKLSISSSVNTNVVLMFATILSLLLIFSRF